jgi:HEAT repeat protein
VTPPSGRFIVQLFLVPGVIVALAVLILLGFRYLVGGSHTPQYFLERLKSDNNPDIRWRAASDLAQILKRPESTALRSDATFALDLASRLDAALDDLEREEKITAERIKSLPAKERERSWTRLAPQRDYVQYLAAALGDFVVPVGASLLCRIAEYDASPDLVHNTLQRRKAVWALGNLGENRKRFQQLTAPEQAAIIKALKQETEGKPPRATWARTALYYLDVKDTNVPEDVVKVETVLARCARDPDRFLRAQVALVLGFWYGPRAESTLIELAHDDGHGTLIGVPDDEGNHGR